MADVLGNWKDYALTSLTTLVVAWLIHSATIGGDRVSKSELNETLRELRATVNRVGVQVHKVDNRLSNVEGRLESVLDPPRNRSSLSRN